MGIQHSAGNMGYTPNTALTEEVTLSTSGISAESNADGPVANMVPREGGNTFRGNASGLFSGSKLQMSNLTDELRARGLTTVNEVVRVWDATFTARRPDQAGQGLVLRLVPRVGQRAAGRRQVLEPDAGHDVLHPGPGSAGDRLRVVRVEGRAHHVAGVAEEQVQLPRRSAAQLQLPWECRGDDVGQSAGIDARLSLRPGRAVSGHLELAADEQAAARGRCGRRVAELARGDAAGRDGGPHFHHGAVDRHDLQRVEHLQRGPGRSALHPALLAVLRHRVPQLQDRVPARGERSRISARKRTTT